MHGKCFQEVMGIILFTRCLEFISEFPFLWFMYVLILLLLVKF